MKAATGERVLVFDLPVAGFQHCPGKFGRGTGRVEIGSDLGSRTTASTEKTVPVMTVCGQAERYLRNKEIHRMGKL
jgi:hypothetical protein